MPCRLQLGTYLFIILASSMAINVAHGAELSCEDVRLKEMLKPELDLSAVEKKCGMSSNSEFEKVSVTMRDGKLVTASCCAAVRFQMHEISELQLEEKRQACSSARLAASKVECAGRTCLVNNINVIGGTRASLRKLILQSHDASKKTGAACESIMKRFQEKISQDVVNINRAIAGARSQVEKDQILSASSMGSPAGTGAK